MTNTETLLLVLVQAVANKKPITMSYQKEGEPVEVRVVEPTDVRAVGEEGNFVLVGWCRTRGAERTFRVDRIQDAAPLRGGRPRFTKPHLAHLAEKDVEHLLAELSTPVKAPHTATEYNAHGDWLAEKADAAEARGLAPEAERLWELADLAWELAQVS